MRNQLSENYQIERLKASEKKSNRAVPVVSTLCCLNEHVLVSNVQNNK